MARPRTDEQSPLEDRISRQPHLNDQVNTVLAAAGVTLLPLFNESLAAWQSHVSNHCPGYRFKHIRHDCGHFCEPSPLWDLANARLLTHIQAVRHTVFDL